MVGDRVVALGIGVGWINRLEASVETEGEEVERQTKSYAIAHSDLLIELAEIEAAARLVSVFMNGPDVACVNEERSVDFPEKERAVLNACVEFDVARLVDEVDAFVVTVVSARSERTYRPSPNAVGAP